MKMIRFLTILLCFHISFVSALPSEQLFDEGVKAYNAGDFETALQHWNKIHQVFHLESSPLYNNIGNAYYKLTDYPSAILYYEKAIKLNPNNEDAKYNLNVANLKIIDKIEPLPELFYKKWYKNFVNSLSANQWALLFFILLLIATILFSLYIVSNEIQMRKIGFYVGMILFLMTTIVFFFGHKSYRTRTSESFAIVYSSRLPVKSSPSDMGTDLFFIHAGTKVETVDRIGSWVKIKIADGNQGWVEEEQIEVI